MQFTQESGLRTPTDLIPSGFLCWALVTLKSMANSKETNGLYGNLEFRVYAGQPFAGKVFWDMVADPDDTKNSEAWRQGGMAALTRMLESAGFVDPAKPETYTKLNGYSCQQILSALDGKRVAVRVKIEKGGEGYGDKNKVGDYLTPNPQSSGNKGFVKLMAGDHNLPQGAPSVNSAFGQPAAGSTQAPLPFGQTATSHPNAAGPIAPAAGQGPMQGQNGLVPLGQGVSAGTNVRSPFNPSGPAPGWMGNQPRVS